MGKEQGQIFTHISFIQFIVIQTFWRNTVFWLLSTQHPPFLFKKNKWGGEVFFLLVTDAKVKICPAG